MPGKRGGAERPRARHARRKTREARVGMLTRRIKKTIIKRIAITKLKVCAEDGSIRYAAISAPNTTKGDLKSKRKVKFTPD